MLRCSSKAVYPKLARTQRIVFCTKLYEARFRSLVDRETEKPVKFKSWPACLLERIGQRILAHRTAYSTPNVLAPCLYICAGINQVQSLNSYQTYLDKPMTNIPATYFTNLQNSPSPKEEAYRFAWLIDDNANL